MIRRCNLCWWTCNYHSPITWRTAQLPPLIESNQDSSQPKLSHSRSCLYFVHYSVGNSWTVFLSDQYQYLVCWLFTKSGHKSHQTALPSWASFCSANQSSKKDQFVSGSYHPTIWKIFHLQPRLWSPVAVFVAGLILVSCYRDLQFSQLKTCSLPLTVCLVFQLNK